MKPVTSSAFGKIILFGEHAVVYGRPAIAVPVTQVRVQVTIAPFSGAAVAIDAADLSRRYKLTEARPGDPLAAIIRLTCDKIGVEPKGLSIRVRSTIPIARGLGSGAAVSVAIVRALAKSFARDLSREDISALVFEAEKLHHGTPSGIDNTVISYELPVYFVRGQPVQTFRVARPFLIAIADSGIASSTKVPVGDVRRAWEADHARYESYFDRIGEIVVEARAAIERGDVTPLGSLMLKNQALLEQIGVSSNEIEELVDAAVGAGAEGAKLSGAGRGGNVIALVDDESKEYVERAMKRAGAARVFVTQVG